MHDTRNFDRSPLKIKLEELARLERTHGLSTSVYKQGRLGSDSIGIERSVDYVLAATRRAIQLIDAAKAGKIPTPKFDYDDGSAS